jgi:hypothetical protein
MSIGMMVPTYNKIYIEDKEATVEKAITVQWEHENGFSQTVLREADREDVFRAVLDGRPVYVGVTEDALVYPYAMYDFVEINNDGHDDFRQMLGIEFTPRYFQEATLVATPKMGLF